jgi:hypothetical protein
MSVSSGQTLINKETPVKSRNGGPKEKMNSALSSSPLSELDDPSLDLGKRRVVGSLDVDMDAVDDDEDSPFKPSVCSLFRLNLDRDIYVEPVKY